jgi:hypothetical protein
MTALRPFMAALRPEVTALPCAVSGLRPEGATLLHHASEHVPRAQR